MCEHYITTIDYHDIIIRNRFGFLEGKIAKDINYSAPFFDILKKSSKLNC